MCLALRVPMTWLEATAVEPCVVWGTAEVNLEIHYFDKFVTRSSMKTKYNNNIQHIYCYYLLKFKKIKKIVEL